jgi:signal transduction histidine kinase
LHTTIEQKRPRRYKRWFALVWQQLAGNGKLIFGASLKRTLLEVALLTLLLYPSTVGSVTVGDYRLLAVAFLPGGLLVTTWGAVRLRRLAAPTRPLYFLKLLIFTPAVAALQAVLQVLIGLFISLLYFPLDQLAAPTVPVQLDTELNFAVAVGPLFNFFVNLISGPRNFDVDVVPVFVLVARGAVLAAGLGGLFLIMRGLLVALSLPGRWLTRQAQQKLRWKLTLSHFWAVIATLTTAAVGGILMSLLLLNILHGSTDSSIARDSTAHLAQLYAQPLENLWRNSGPFSATELNLYLERALGQNRQSLDDQGKENRLTLLTSQLPRIVHYPVQFGVLTDLQGKVVASTDPQRFRPGIAFVDAGFSPSAQKAWQTVLARALQGKTSLDQLRIAQASPEIVIGGVYPIKDRTGQVALVLAVARPTTAALMPESGLLAWLVRVGGITVLFAIFSSLFTLWVAMAFGYFMSRRIVRDLETLEAGAAELAAGNLTQRVNIETQDEIGRLVTSFNQMAASLEEGQHNLALEKSKVEKALQVKRELVANVSHELRTPVSTIRAHIEWLLLAAEKQGLARSSSEASAPEVNSPEMYQYLEIIERETERLSALIEDLLDLSRLEAEAPALEFEQVTIAGVAEEVKQALGLLAKRERQVSLSLNLSPDLPPVRADRKRLVQVLVNLTRNAINYTPEGGIVSIGSACDGPDRVALWVADTGIGIAPEELSTIFERFYRADSSRSRATGGAGLGLAIVKTLVEAMGGSIEVESVPGEGSKFTVKLPLA